MKKAKEKITRRCSQLTSNNNGWRELMTRPRYKCPKCGNTNLNSNTKGFVRSRLTGRYRCKECWGMFNLEELIK